MGLIFWYSVTFKEGKQPKIPPSVFFNKNNHSTSATATSIHRKNLIAARTRNNLIAAKQSSLRQKHIQNSLKAKEAQSEREKSAFLTSQRIIQHQKRAARNLLISRALREQKALAIRLHVQLIIDRGEAKTGKVNHNGLYSQSWMKRRAEHERWHQIAKFKKDDNKQPCLSAIPAITAKMLDEGASKIQIAWINHTLVRHYRDFQVNLGGLLVDGGNFDACRRILTCKALQKSAVQFLSSLGISCNEMERDDECKMFLSSFFFFLFPEEQSGHEGNEFSLLLNEAANTLVNSIIFIDFKSLSKREDIRNNYFAYKHLFLRWKLRDKNRLLEDLLAFYDELERLRESVHLQVDYLTEWKPKIDAQQRQIYRKICAFFGDEGLNHLQLILKSDLQQRDDEKSFILPTTVSTSTPAHTPPIQSRSLHPSIENNNAERFLFLNLSKQELFHEMFMQDDFKIEHFFAKKLSIPPHQVQDYLANRKSIQLDTMASSTISPIQWASYVRGRLIDLAPQNGPYRQQIYQVFDEEHLQVKERNGVLDLKELFLFCVSMMKRFCAPVRDDQVKELENFILNQTGENVDARENQRVKTTFLSVIRLLDQMTFDMINFFTKTIQSHVLLNVTEYERSCIEIKNPHPLAIQLAPYSIKEDEDKETFNVKEKICCFFVDLLTQKEQSADEAMANTDLPETLEFDWERICNLRRYLKFFSKIGAVSILVKSQFRLPAPPPSIDALFEKEKNREFDEESIDEFVYLLLQATAPAQLHRSNGQQNVSSIISTTMGERSLSVDSIKGIVHRIFVERDPLYHLFRSRIVATLKRDFSHQSSSTDSLPVVGAEMGFMQDQITEHLIRPFCKIFRLNFDIYQEVYRKILLHEEN